MLAIAGAQVYGAADGGEGLQEVWPPILVAWWLPSALGVVLHRRRAQRWVCMIGTILSGLVAVVLFGYGGVYQLPAVIALALAGRDDPDAVKLTAHLDQAPQSLSQRAGSAGAWEFFEATPPSHTGTRARAGVVLLVVAMLLWSVAAGVFVQVLEADSDPYGAGAVTSLAAALLAATLTAAGAWCTRGALPHRRVLVAALVVPALLLAVAGGRSAQQDQRERDCPSLVGELSYHLDRHGRCVRDASLPAFPPAAVAPASR